ncbi:hypothetical protein QTP88_024443 [Uroleucon formosanum]
MHVYLYYKKKKSGLTTASSIHNTPSYTLWSETPKIRLWYFLTTGDCYSTKTFRIADETFKNVKRIIYLIGLITAILYYGYTNSSLFKFPIPISYYHINHGQNLVEEEFIPSVTAACKAGYMTIKVTTNQPFVGAVHARDYRSSGCLSYGNGTKLTTLGINLLATQGSTDYCGIFINNKTEERSVPIAIRIHRTLELADDKYYVITCGKSGFKNSKNETSLVSLKFLDNGKRIQEVVYSHPYTLRAEISRHDAKTIIIFLIFHINSIIYLSTYTNIFNLKITRFNNSRIQYLLSICGLFNKKYTYYSLLIFQNFASFDEVERRHIKHKSLKKKIKTIFSET